MHDGDRLVGQLEIAIDAGDPGIVPFADLSEVDVRQDAPGQLHPAGWTPSMFIHRHDATHDHRKLHEAILRQLVGFERSVRCAEIDGPCADLFDAAARADRLVVEPTPVFCL